ncbi:MAG: hypothetical protein HETSPECPRED_009203 [Heterodermia speciosa]|uniref:Uncharacterized protein n=1 Tax=Heterodermia speciosa TaxID=116794 RepID=A0A8H3G245_9LECA|nr:MAG: hypothetical protein HETSPECPRED_009203 [Heterodermia speciosa]
MYPNQPSSFAMFLSKVDANTTATAQEFMPVGPLHSTTSMGNASAGSSGSRNPVGAASGMEVEGGDEGVGGDEGPKHSATTARDEKAYDPFPASSHSDTAAQDDVLPERKKRRRRRRRRAGSKPPSLPSPTETPTPITSEYRIPNIEPHMEEEKGEVKVIAASARAFDEGEGEHIHKVRTCLQIHALVLGRLNKLPVGNGVGMDEVKLLHGYLGRCERDLCFMVRRGEGGEAEERLREKCIDVLELVVGRVLGLEGMVKGEEMDEEVEG